MSDDAIAVIGMSGRFPGAPSVEALWRALLAGENLTRPVERSELANTLHAPYLSDPNYVFRCAVLDDPDLFDAEAFGMTPAEAMMTDPQQRLFLTCCKETLEQAGYPAPEASGLRTGVYAGSSISTYLLHNLLRSSAFRVRDPLQLAMGTDKDFLVSRVAYKLNLRGPAVAIQTACSTSLVAIHQAVQALLGGEADLALAGGATVSALGALGYLYTPEGIRSPDGLCRPFDANAAGTIFGDGIGVVALRRLDDALADGDYIYAVVRGSAVNNDGNDKAGYTAPSVNGQTSVIAEALDVSGVAPDEIAFMEAHGTATLLGDPIEVRALTQAYGSSRRNHCALGSIKSNLGHLDAASGVTGFIKAALALRHRTLPASLNFSAPNPALDLDRSPFFVCTERLALPAGRELYAGVSSFGIGGTNAHIILSSPPAAPFMGKNTGEPRLYMWSARSEQGLERLLAETGRSVEAMPEVAPIDVAHTLARGRSVYRHRAVFVDGQAPDRAAAAKAVRHCASRKKKKLIFLFPGQGSQWVGVAEPLYRDHPGFRGQVDRLCDMLVPTLGEDLRRWLFPSPQDREEAQEKGRHTQWAQPALFVLCRALSAVYREYGLVPDMVFGHSLGELVAACEAGGMSETDAATLIVRRGFLMEQSAEGAMLAVAAEQAAVKELPGDILAALDIAACNGPRQTVLAGQPEAIAAAMAVFEKLGISCRRLGVTRAFHSRLMDPVLPAWHREACGISCRALDIPLVSNLSGKIRQRGEILDAEYWTSHLRSPVAFVDGVQSILADMEQGDSEAVFLEVGPGSSLGTLVKTAFPKPTVIFSADADAVVGQRSLLTSIGRLWAAGCNPDLSEAVAKGRTVPLPIPPLEPKPYWVVPDADIDMGRADKPKEGGSLPPRERSLEKPLVGEEKSNLEQQLIEIWRAVLLIDEIGPRDDFFSLGGDSMQALEISRAAKRRGLTITPGLIFEHPTVFALAKFVQAASPMDDAPQVAKKIPALPPTVDTLMADGCERFCLQLALPLSSSQIRETFAALIARHEMLCIRRTGQGWRHADPSAALSDIFQHDRLQETVPTMQSGLQVSLSDDGPQMQIGVAPWLTDAKGLATLFRDLDEHLSAVYDGKTALAKEKTPVLEQWVEACLARIDTVEAPPLMSAEDTQIACFGRQDSDEWHRWDYVSEFDHPWTEWLAEMEQGGQVLASAIAARILGKKEKHGSVTIWQRGNWRELLGGYPPLDDLIAPLGYWLSTDLKPCATASDALRESRQVLSSLHSAAGLRAWNGGGELKVPTQVCVDWLDGKVSKRFGSFEITNRIQADTENHRERLTLWLAGDRLACTWCCRGDASIQEELNMLFEQAAGEMADWLQRNRQAADFSDQQLDENDLNAILMQLDVG